MRCFLASSRENVNSAGTIESELSSLFGGIDPCITTGTDGAGACVVTAGLRTLFCTLGCSDTSSTSLLSLFDLVFVSPVPSLGGLVTPVLASRVEIAAILAEDRTAGMTLRYRARYPSSRAGVNIQKECTLE